MAARENTSIIISPQVLHAGHRTRVSVSGAEFKPAQCEAADFPGLQIIERKFVSPGELHFTVQVPQVSNPELSLPQIPGHGDLVKKDYALLILAPLLANMSYIPAADFVYGRKQEGSRVIRRTDQFLCCIHEVSGAEYSAFLNHVIMFGDGPFAHPDQPVNKDHTPDNWADREINTSNQPVVGVDFFDAWAYCRWRDARLPSELEWEHAARGTEGLDYPWGDEYKQGLAVTNEKEDKSQFVTSKPQTAGPYGLLHASGNVWEMTLPERGLSDGVLLKGGSFRTPLLQSMLHESRQVDPLYRSSDTGFRCVTDITAETVQKIEQASREYAESQLKIPGGKSAGDPER